MLSVQLSFTPIPSGSPCRRDGQDGQDVLIFFQMINIMISSASLCSHMIIGIMISHLYCDVHPFPYTGVGVHHLVLWQQQTLFVPPRQVPRTDAHPVYCGFNRGDCDVDDDDETS